MKKISLLFTIVFSFSAMFFAQKKKINTVVLVLPSLGNLYEDTKKVELVKALVMR